MKTNSITLAFYDSLVAKTNYRNAAVFQILLFNTSMVIYIFLSTGSVTVEIKETNNSYARISLEILLAYSSSRKTFDLLKSI